MTRTVDEGRVERSTREQRGGHERPSGAGRGGPPALALHLWHRVGMLALLNVIPLFGSLWLWWQFKFGHAQFRKARIGSRFN